MMEKSNREILSEVENYYSGKIAAHGPTPQGVDWNGEESQFIRFKQLSRIIIDKHFFSLNDLGCGYGAFLDYLSLVFNDFTYRGLDISEAMIEAAKKKHAAADKARFSVSSIPDEIADYSIASGIFNVRFERDDAEWWEYLCSTLDLLDRTSRLGFSFNCLTSYSDADKMKPYLYYADPCKVFDLCKRKYSRNIALLHDYNLYEFTIGVTKIP